MTARFIELYGWRRCASAWEQAGHIVDCCAHCNAFQHNGRQWLATRNICRDYAAMSLTTTSEWPERMKVA